MKIKCGDAILSTLNKPITGYEFFLIKKILGDKIIELIDSNNKNVDYKQDDCKLYKINENIVKKELENMKKGIETMKKKKDSDIQVFLIFNNEIEESDRINTNKIEDKEKIKKFKEFINCLKNKLSDSIELINEKEFKYDNIKPIINDLIQNDKIVNKIEFNTPNFENAKHAATETNKFSDNYKEFKSIIRGQLDEYSKLIMIT